MAETNTLESNFLPINFFLIFKKKNILEGINSRLKHTEKWISKLEDRVVEIMTTEQKNFFK